MVGYLVSEEPAQSQYVTPLLAFTEQLPEKFLNIPLKMLV